jgi:hypothetical protein
VERCRAFASKDGVPRKTRQGSVQTRVNEWFNSCKPLSRSTRQGSRCRPCHPDWASRHSKSHSGTGRGGATLIPFEHESISSGERGPEAAAAHRASSYGPRRAPAATAVAHHATPTGPLGPTWQLRKTNPRCAQHCQHRGGTSPRPTADVARGLWPQRYPPSRQSPLI